MKPRGELAIVLHTHMPYVEGGAPWPPAEESAFLREPDGFGVWPFGEEWLWEAVATSYLPLLEVLGRAPITLSLTPVLCDQLEAPGAIDRCLRFLTEVRPESHRRDLQHFRDRGEEAVLPELERSAAGYAAAAERLAALPASGLVGELGRHAGWTSAATHAVLPLLASDPGINLQIQTGVASHRRRFDNWRGGFWLPECAYAPWLDEVLEEAGVRGVCVELAHCHLRPLATEAGPVLWPIDRQTISLVWSQRGYPAGDAYRDYHGHTPHHHRVWRNDGRPYDAALARAQVDEDARDFVARVGQRLQDGGVCVFALDTELLGHWWYEGVWWLDAVLEESARQGLRLTTLDDALERHDPDPVPPDLGVTSWGAGGDLRTWSGPAVADLAWLARSAELRALTLDGPPSDRALRELLALQSSDWAFLAASGTAGTYPRERAHAHARAFAEALERPAAVGPELRNLAPELVGWGG
ncbi:MAG TPA: 1,4-alpha-glucan branching protein domain-containing protein [Solirubrobacteraceae bacterium]|nr:1,4-alpha-glucan branching protein domain-containing protein [Solirubrobacteraceae bacterium]